MAFEAAGMALVLLAAAVLGKLIGAGLSAWPMIGGGGALLIGLSMVPRAEVSLIIMGYGHALGAWAVPDNLLSAMVLVSLATALVTPLLLGPLLARQAKHARSRRRELEP
jgi:Kef-type K+ transport system membrane component KefB